MRREAGELGACAILDKPLGRNDLRAALRTVSELGAAEAVNA